MRPFRGGSIHSRCMSMGLEPRKAPRLGLVAIHRESLVVAPARVSDVVDAAADRLAGGPVVDVQRQRGVNRGEALAEILRSDFTRLIVVETDGAVIGSLQLTFIPHLSYVGQRRAIFESVHVAPAFQNKGAGAALVQFAIDAAQDAGCGQIVLTSSNSRLDAHRFWKRMGFEASHVGMKLHLKR